MSITYYQPSSFQDLLDNERIKPIDYEFVCSELELPEEYLLKNINKIPWHVALKFQKISEEAICLLTGAKNFPNNIRMQRNLAWALISNFQVLSDEFIREYKNEVAWDLIIQFQRGCTSQTVFENLSNISIENVVTAANVGNFAASPLIIEIYNDVDFLQKRSNGLSTIGRQRFWEGLMQCGFPYMTKETIVELLIPSKPRRSFDFDPLKELSEEVSQSLERHHPEIRIELLLKGLLEE